MTSPNSFSSLPPELLIQILSYATTISPHDTAIAVSRRSEHLRALSLFPELRFPAQAALWDDLSFASPTTVHKWLSSPATQRGMKTSRLELIGVHAGAAGLSGQLACRVLAKVRGVNQLVVRDFGRLSAEKVLGSDSLRALKSFTLMSPLADRHNNLTKVTPTFRLTTLTITMGSASPALFEQLLACSAHTLRSLYLSLLASSPSYTGLVSALPLVLPTLTHLSLQHRPSPALLATLAHCHSLESLTLHSAVPLAQALDHLPGQSLRRLELQFDYNLERVVEVLRGRIGPGGPLGKAEVVRIPRATKSMFVLCGLSSFLTECADGGIVLEIDEGVSDLRLGGTLHVRRNGSGDTPVRS